MAKIQAVWDEKLGKFIYPEPEKKNKEGQATVYDPTIARLPIARTKIDEICSVAGFVPNADTEKGKGIQKATFATKFIEKAVDKLLESYPKAEAVTEVVEEAAEETEQTVEEPVSSGRKSRK